MRDNPLSEGDWIKIKIKFSGACLNCKKKLSIGELGYWSRKAKSIVHENCYLQFNTSNQPQEQHEGYSKNSSVQIREKDNSESTFLKLPGNVQCYICDNSVDIHDPLITELFKVEDRKDRLEVVYCASCLRGFNTAIFNDYRTSFQQKIKR